MAIHITKVKNCWRLLINSVAKDLITKNKFQVKSKENSYRNYSSIESFSEFIYRLILTREKFKKLPKIINYCSEKNINITEICNVIKKISIIKKIEYYLNILK